MVDTRARGLMVRRDRGTIFAVVAVLISLAGASAMLLGAVTVAAVESARARTAADAAALAAVEGTMASGEDLAREWADSIAQRNGATLESLTLTIDPGPVISAVVQVRVGRSVARARAMAGP